MDHTPLYFAFGAGFVIVSVAIRNKFSELARTGVEAEGVIVDFIENADPNGPPKYPIIQFATTENLQITGSFKIYYTGIEKGQAVTVLYNPANPNQFIVKSKMYVLIPRVFLVAGVALIAISIYKFFR